MNTDKIGKFIASKRKEKNMTQKELASKLGVTDRAVSKWERGVGCPDISLLEELSKVLEVSIVDLLNGENMEKTNILERDLIESMKYSKDYTKSKIKNIVNIILVVIITCICTILTFLNIANSYMLNKNYNMVSLPEETNETINNIEKYCDIILNNQGIYTDEDYKILVKYATKVKNKLNDKTKEYLFKEKYTMKDYYKFEDYYEKNLHETYYDNKSKYYEYFILLKYDTNVVDNLLKYQSSQESIDDLSYNLSTLVNNSYKYTADIEHLAGIYNGITIINMIYHKEEMLLKDIVEVGGLQ